MDRSQRDLDRLSVRYATYHDRSDAERTAQAAALAEMQAGERVLLETCHRVELIALDAGSHGGATAGEVRGRDAIRRVFEVAAGFDSAVIAEEQLLGQVRTAYDRALTTRTSGPILNELLRRAIAFGRRVRSHARPGADRSLADRGVAWLLERLADGEPALVAGTGEMGSIAAHRLAARGHPVTVHSRSADRGARMVQRLPPGRHASSTGDLSPSLVARHRALILAIRSRAALLRAEHLTAPMLPWTLDLSSPPAVDPEAVTLLGDRLIALDELGRLPGAEPVLEPRVERRLRLELDAEVERYIAWLRARGTTDAVAILHEDARAVRDRHLERLRRGEALAPEQLALVERVTAAMVGELLHRPSMALRRGDADAAAVRRLFGLEGGG